ncbi:UDP-2-acetamido-3-amino-2,3-dideoxy-D-glucuronate N-acetyltransferase [Thiorhodovibrio winogradskyi]|uniref:UDP-2-acetamido-3-amino-2, 3-dideoxy-D-glucuronate N-acetyltransferase n=1 Tax=Thiorhodovibrio winogradskyi TaxID=77007 RepID=A0ABZ0SB80_9GAMM
MVFTNVINPRSAINRKEEYRHTLVKQGATIGANATILCGVTLGQYCFIGAGAVITKDVKPYALMAGVPARQIGWMSAHGERLDLPLEGEGQARCFATGQRYRLVDGRIATS